MPELQKLAQNRARGLDSGEPIETLNWDGMTDVELNSLSHALMKDSKYTLAEIAARRCVPLALLRTGEKSQNYAGALRTHASALQRLGLFAMAEQLHREELDVVRQTVGEKHSNYAVSLNNLGLAVQSQGRDAEGLFREALEIVEATLLAEHPHVQQLRKPVAAFDAPNP